MNDIAIMFDQELGSLVRLHRVARGLSQVELADEIGLTPAQVMHYEAGTNRLSVLRFWEIMSALDQQPQRVLGQLTDRLSFAPAGQATKDKQGLDFLATNRGRQIIKALAMCDEPAVLDVLADLIMTVGVQDHARAVPSEGAAKLSNVKASTTR